MSSFIRKNPHLSSLLKSDENISAKTTTNITYPLGLKPSTTGTPTLLCSTGIPSLDVLLGSGLSVSSLLTILEDLPSSKANYCWGGVVKCFLAEMIAAASADWMRKDGGWMAVVGWDLKGYLESLPKPESTSGTSSAAVDEPMTSTNDDKLSIAWRYTALKQVDSTIQKPAQSASSSLGHVFDLGRKIGSLPKPLLDQERIHVIDLLNLEVQMNDSVDCTYKQVFGQLNELIRKCQKFGLGRIVIGGLGAPGWSCDCKEEDGCGPAWFTRKLSHLLQTVESTHSVVAMITVPVAYLSESLNSFQSSFLQIEEFKGTANLPPKWLPAVEHFSDAVFQLKPLSAITPVQLKEKMAADPLNREYDGFLDIRKPLRRAGSFKANLAETGSLAFKIKRRKFVIEKFHLPPGVEDSSSSPSNLPCSSGESKSIFESKKNSLDF